jgi:tetratricopeptide (TPR) repeat protein
MVGVKGLLIALVACCACAAPEPPPPVSVTSAVVFEKYREVDAAESALHRGRPAEALPDADHALDLVPDDPWSLYERGVALTALGRTDEAVTAFLRAERGFATQPHRKGLATYGRARALDLAGRCTEARAAYEAYAALMRPYEPLSATMAIEYGRDCREPAPPVPNLTEVDTALIAADSVRALVIATEKRATARSPRDQAWTDEARGAALIGLQRDGEAVDVLERTAREYAAAGDRAGVARALYGEAIALRAADGCSAAATRAYERYAAFVRPFAPEDAVMAERYSRDCPATAAPAEK